MCMCVYVYVWMVDPVTEGIAIINAARLDTGKDESHQGRWLFGGRQP